MCPRFWLSIASGCFRIRLSRTCSRRRRGGRRCRRIHLVGSVLVFKERHNLSDAQTAEAVKFDIRWKVACGLSLTQMSLGPSTLVYWRWIARSTHPDRVFDAVAEVITETEILRGRRRRCVDSTVFDDAMATPDTVTQLVTAIRKVAQVVAGAPEVISWMCPWITPVGQAAD